MRLPLEEILKPVTNTDLHSFVSLFSIEIVTVNSKFRIKYGHFANNFNE